MSTTKQRTEWSLDPALPPMVKELCQEVEEQAKCIRGLKGRLIQAHALIATMREEYVVLREMGDGMLERHRKIEAHYVTQEAT